MRAIDIEIDGSCASASSGRNSQLQRSTNGVEHRLLTSGHVRGGLGSVGDAQSSSRPWVAAVFDGVAQNDGEHEDVRDWHGMATYSPMFPGQRDKVHEGEKKK